MVVGEGLIADRFLEYASNEHILIFASDHSDSRQVDRGEEPKLLEVLKEHSDKLIVYFSTAAIYDPTAQQNEYVLHRLRMESLIESQAKRYLIIRVPTLVGRTIQDKTLLHSIVNSVRSGEKFEVWTKAERNLLDVDDLFFLTDEILRQKMFTNQTINIANAENIKIADVVAKVEAFFSVKAKFDLVAKGEVYQISIDLISPLVLSLGVRFSSDYVDRLLSKYFRHLKGDIKTLSIVVPTYFAEDGVNEFYKRTVKVLDQLRPHFESEIIFVNDGSTDKTWPLLQVLSQRDSRVKALNFSRNFGNQIAITAGLDRANSDIVVIIDDDLQDPPETILNMIAIWENGFDVVYAVRRKRKAIGSFFRLAAKTYYRIMDYLSEVKIPVDTGDFRLIDKKVVFHLRQMKEENRYFRGMVSWIGFKQFGLLYDRDARFAGESNFTLRKYFRFAFAGISSFSEKPLYFSSLMGLLITFISLIFAVWIVYLKITQPSFTIRGWASIVTILLFFGGIQLLSMGVTGLYIGKIYREVKGRPLYIVESESGFSNKSYVQE